MMHCLEIPIFAREIKSGRRNPDLSVGFFLEGGCVFLVWGGGGWLEGFLPRNKKLIGEYVIPCVKKEVESYDS